MSPLPAIELRNQRFDWSRTYVAGVINVTPDSFSDGGLHAHVDDAVRRGLELARAGADIIDIGGESTRPNADEVPAAVELERVLPVIEGLRACTSVPLSIDTTKAEVASAALAAGVEIVNDISGGLFDPDIIAVAAERGAVYICGHVRGSTVAAVHAAENTAISIAEITDELDRRLAALPETLRRRTIVDPGLGFGKKAVTNLELLRSARTLADTLGAPVMLGPSRKRFVRGLVSAAHNLSAQGDKSALIRALDAGTVGACLAAASCGAHFVRAHNIELLKPALVVYEASRGFSF